MIKTLKKGNAQKFLSSRPEQTSTLTSPWVVPEIHRGRFIKSEFSFRLSSQGSRTSVSLGTPYTPRSSPQDREGLDKTRTSPAPPSPREATCQCHARRWRGRRTECPYLPRGPGGRCRWEKGLQDHHVSTEGLWGRRGRSGAGRLSPIPLYPQVETQRCYSRLLQRL